MPRGDGTGPTGAGSMTGRGLGHCTGAGSVRYGTGLGMRLGRRLLRRCGFAGGYGRGFAINRNPMGTQK